MITDKLKYLYAFCQIITTELSDVTNNVFTFSSFNNIFMQTIIVGQQHMWIRDQIARQLDPKTSLIYFSVEFLKKR